VISDWLVGGTDFAAKRLQILAQGFYEAELVKSAVKKKVFLVLRVHVRRSLATPHL
jgi:hypothetical protein